MNITQLFKELRQHNVVLRIKDEKLLCELPKQGIPDGLRAALLANRDALKTYITSLNRESGTRVDIPRRNPSLTRLPLSSAQQRLWLIDQVEEGESHYNTYFVFRVTGNLKLDALNEAFLDIVLRHEALHTNFTQIDGEPFQVVMKPEFVREKSLVEHIDMPALFLDGDTQLNELILYKIHHKFDLSQDLLIRITVVSRAPSDSIVIFVIHHIASDGWSGALIANELNQCYQSRLSGLPVALPPLPLQYADFALWQHDQISKGLLDKSIDYWCKALVDLPVVHNIPLDNTRSPEPSFHGGRVQQVLPSALHNALQKVAVQQNVTMFMLLETVLAVLVSYWSREQDISLGVPIAGRIHPQLEPLIGFFVNTLVIRTKVDSSKKFEDLLKENKKTIYDAFSHQDLPFDKLVEIMQPVRAAGVSPLFQILFVMQNNKKANLQLADLQMQDIEFDGQIVKFDIELHATEKESGLEFSWLYAKNLFGHQSIERLNDAFVCLLEGIVVNPACEIRLLPFLSDKDKAKLSVWGHGSSSDVPVATAHQLIEQQVLLNPHTTALVFDKYELSYQELNSNANKLANELLARGVKPDDRVAILVDRSFSMVISVLAVLKAGACYVPIDSALPEGRLKTILSDLGKVFVLTDTNHQDIAKYGLECNLLLLDDPVFQQIIEKRPHYNPVVENLTASNLAYVLYTSGSTGKPKAIEMPHGPLVNLIHGIIDAEPALRGPHTSIQFASIGFDMSFTDIFLTLGGGGCLLLISSEYQYDTAYLVDLIRKKKVSSLNLPYAMLQSIADYCQQNQLQIESLRCIISTAEPLKITKAIRSFFETHLDCRLINHYGPSETHVVTALTLDNNPSLWPEYPSIGAPLTNTCFHILDDSLRPVPVGVVGHLYFEGSCLARGYMNQPELTADRFISHSIDGKNTRLYNTGDLVRFLPDGELEFWGRVDNQVKIRGFRIELNEIENNLLTHEKIKDAVVLVRESVGDEKYIVAYILVYEAYYDDKSQYINEAFTNELRLYLKRNLPEYMVPNAFVLLKQFPLNTNGKVNIQALPMPKLFDAQRQCVLPKNEIEKVLLDVWTEILNLDVISTTDNFFQIGGHSLSAVKMLSKINLVYGTNLSLKTIFFDTTIVAIANLIEAWKLNQLNFNKLCDDELAVEGFF